MISKAERWQTIIESIDGEIWVPIFRDYEISNMGRVKSTKWGYPLLLRWYKNNRNYHCVDFRVNGKKKKSTIHRLVALIFLKNTDPKKVTVNHHFGKDDNRATSLSWMTHAENSQHGVENGLIYRGVDHYATTLDETQVKTIKSIKGQLTQQKIADYFKVNRSTISPIMRGISWKHI